MKDIQTYLTDLSSPWRRGAFIGGAGLLACGWSEDNKIFMLFPDYFVIGNPITGEREFMVENDELLNRLSIDNLEFDFKEVGQKIKVFGIRGGNGNHYTSDGWSLIEIQQDSQEKIFGITNCRNFERSEGIFWKNYDLIKLNRLEFGQWCGFSPDERYFGIFGSGGVEVFKRE